MDISLILNKAFSYLLRLVQWFSSFTLFIKSHSGFSVLVWNKWNSVNLRNSSKSIFLCVCVCLCKIRGVTEPGKRKTTNRQFVFRCYVSIAFLLIPNDLFIIKIFIKRSWILLFVLTSRWRQFIVKTKKLF